MFSIIKEKISVFLNKNISLLNVVLFKLATTIIAIYTKIVSFHKKTVLLKSKKSKIFTVSFFAILVLSTSTSTVVAQQMIDITNYPVLKTYLAFFSWSAPDGVGVVTDTIANRVSSGYTALIMDILNNSISLVLYILFFWYAIKSLIFALDKDDREPSNVFNAGAILAIGLSINAFTVTVDTGQHHKFGRYAGETYEMSMVQYYMSQLLFDVLLDSAKSTKPSDNKQYLVSEFKFGSETALYKYFEDFSTAFVKSEMLDQEYNVNIVFEDNTYKTDFNLGEENFTPSFGQAVKLNNKALALDYDLTKSEEAFVKDYIQSQFNHASKVKERTKAFIFTSNEGFFNQYKEIEAYAAHWSNYCDSIYAPEKQYIDNNAYVEYLHVAAKCASSAFVKKHYKNPLYEFNSSDIIRSGNGMVFGDSSANHKVKLEDAISLTKTVCSGGYFACVEAVNYTANIEKIHNVSAGILTYDIIEANKFLFSWQDDATGLTDNYSNKSFLTVNNGFVDNYADSPKSDQVVTFKGVSGDFSERTVLTLQTLLDPNNLPNPNIDEVIRIVLGGEPTDPFNRMNTCFVYNGMVKNGFRCEDINTELGYLNASTMHMGLQLKLFSTSYAGLKSAARKAYKDKKSKKVDIGESQLLKRYGGEAMAVGAGILGTYAGGMIFKEDHYYSSVGVVGAAVTNMIFSGLGMTQINPVNNLGNFLVTFSIGGYLFQYSYLWVMTMFVLGALFEVVVYIINIHAMSAVQVHNRGAVKAAEYVAKKFYLKLLMLIIMVKLQPSFEYLRDTVLSSMSEYLYQSIISVTGDASWTMWVANIGFAVFMMFVYVYMGKKAATEPLLNIKDSIYSSIK
ncbi:hypothetical protein [Vibrio harveyi]|uniref:hypothetical protein n=1 Tax=Vibrio harveyi TaxID=669 RepID=UPI0023805948|nr:hypothetical protein [Vibrio harveyi]